MSSWSFLLYEICTPYTLIHSLVRSRYFIPESATLTLFRKPNPAISHLVKLGRSPEKLEKHRKPFKTTLMELMSSKKNVVSSACAAYKYSWSKMFKSCVFLFVLIIMKNISKARIKRYADIGSPWWAPLSSLKYLVVCPPFITHDSWLFSNILIQSMKLSPNHIF